MGANNLNVYIWAMTILSILSIILFFICHSFYMAYRIEHAATSQSEGNWFFIRLKRSKDFIANTAYAIRKRIELGGMVHLTPMDIDVHAQPFCSIYHI